jgi:peptidoglycan/LPS O-acetylase OafA/YrhL
LQNLITDFRYRPEVDGLRAVAVLIVVFYHAGLGFSGGFIGVDVFFVISGYLITSLILKDAQRGTFTLSNFWQRRIRRIMPAAVVLVVFTLVVGWFILLPEDFVGLGNSALSQTFFAANIYFWRTLDYFSVAADEKPLLHTWSLAVEEQFYVFFPALLLVLFRFRPLRTKTALLSIFLAGTAASFALSLWSLVEAPLASFYLLPSRAWELLLGSVLALLPRPGDLGGKGWPLDLVAWGGLVAILVPSWLYTSETPFPGVAALSPVLGTAAFIWATNGVESGGRRGSARQIMALRPVVFIGLISYSLYLWHWPLLAFARYVNISEPSLTVRVGLVVASLVVATLSWRFVETPFRHHGVAKRPVFIFSFAGASLLLLTALSATVVFARGFPQRVAPEILEIVNVRIQRPEMEQIGIKQVKAADVKELGGNAESSPQLLLWGDSHAWALSPAVAKFCREHNIRGQAIYHPATPPLVDYVSRSNQGLDHRSPEWAEEVAGYIARTGIKNVIVAGYWSKQEQISPPGVLEAAVKSTVQRLSAAGANVYFFLQVPTHEAPVPDAMARSMYFGYTSDAWRVDEQDYARVNQRVLAALGGFPRDQVTIINPGPDFIDPESGELLVQIGNRPIYYDSHHLSPLGAETVAYRSLDAALAPAARSATLEFEELKLIE